MSKDKTREKQMESLRAFIKAGIYPLLPFTDIAESARPDLTDYEVGLIRTALNPTFPSLAVAFEDPPDENEQEKKPAQE